MTRFLQLEITHAPLECSAYSGSARVPARRPAKHLNGPPMATFEAKCRFYGRKNSLQTRFLRRSVIFGNRCFESGCALVSKDFLLRMGGYGLTTAEIHYHLPDHPNLLQQFIWQDYDLAPVFPGLKRFLDFWQHELEGALHSVRVAHNHLVRPSEWTAVDGIFRLH